MFRKSFRKILAIGLAAVMLAGCGAETATNSSVAQGESETATLTETQAANSDAAATTVTAVTTKASDAVAVYDVVIDEASGVKINSHDYVANISGTQITDVTAFKEKLKKLPLLLYLDMCNCGLTNEEMEDLCNTFPDIRIVWELQVGSVWKCRTDAYAFSTLGGLYGDAKLTNDEAQVLKYCTNLVALDIGHNYVYDIDFIANMPNLHILIIIDNMNPATYRQVDDLSVLNNCPNMMYLEIFVTQVSDLSFLATTKEMRDLNMSYCLVTDTTPIYGLTKLERLFMEHSQIPYS